MSYLDEGYNEFLIREQDLGDNSGNTLSPLDFDSNLSDNSIQTAKIGTVSADKIISGSISAKTEITIADQNITIDGKNRRIVIHDGSNPRVILGFQKDGF